MTTEDKLVKRAIAAGISAALALGVAACHKNEQVAAPQKYGQSSQPGDSANGSVERAADSSRQNIDQAAKADDDAVVTAKVKSALIAEPKLHALSIDVDTTAGVVTLKGTADNMEQKQQAEQLATTVVGVRSVKNELVVGRG